jgi:putative hemolysin
MVIIVALLKFVMDKINREAAIKIDQHAWEDDPTYDPVTIAGLREKKDYWWLKLVPALLANKALEKAFDLDLVNALIHSNRNNFNAEFFNGVLSDLAMTTRCSPDDIKKIPEQGVPTIIAGTHHMGAIDAAAVVKLVSQVRGDIKLLGMRFFTNLTGNCKDLIIEVGKVRGRDESNREAIRQATSQALQDGNAVVILGAGTGASELDVDGNPVDDPWRPGVSTFSQEQLELGNEVTVVPAYVHGRNSEASYKLRSFSKEIARFLYLRQFLGKAGENFNVNFGDPISADGMKELFDGCIKDMTCGNFKAADEKVRQKAHLLVAAQVRQRAYIAGGRDVL